MTMPTRPGRTSTATDPTDGFIALLAPQSAIPPRCPSPPISVPTPGSPPFPTFTLLHVTTPCRPYTRQESVDHKCVIFQGCWRWPRVHGGQSGRDIDAVRTSLSEITNKAVQPV